MQKAVLLQKEAIVKEVSDTLTKGHSSFLVEYRGLSVHALMTLRREMRKQNVELKVFKNTLVERAAQALGYVGLEKELTGPNGLVTSFDDPTDGPRIITKFAKKHPKLVVKGGVSEGHVISKENVATLATIPGKPAMVSMVLGVIQAPIRNLAFALQSIADQKK